MLESLFITIGLFFVLLAGLEGGRRIGRRMKVDKDGLGTGAADGVVFGVFGLIVAFTFSTAASRFTERRELIVEQANALGTAHLRLDALDSADRTAIRKHMLRWVELSQTIGSLADDPAKLATVIAEANREQSDAWRIAGAAVEKKNQPALWSFVLAPLNDWIDLSTKRQSQADLGTPPAVRGTLVLLAIVASMLAGFNTSHKPRSMLHTLTFAAIVALLLHVILDMSHARSGLIRVDAVDHTMAQVGDAIRAQLK